MTDPFGPAKVAEVDPQAAAALLRFARFAADDEAMKPGPRSRIRNPDGSAQGETGHERTGRIVEAAVMHLIEQGLLIVPDDLESRLERPIPIARVKE